MEFKTDSFEGIEEITGMVVSKIIEVRLVSSSGKRVAKCAMDRVELVVKTINLPAALSSEAVEDKMNCND